MGRRYGVRRSSRLAASGFVIAWFMARSSAVEASTANRIVAVVNDEVITQADVEGRVTALLEDRERLPTGQEDPAQVREAVLTRLVEQRLMLQEAKRSGISISSDEVLKRLEEIRGRFDSEEAFQRMLSASGLSKEQLKEQLRDQLMVQRLLDRMVRATIVVSPYEISKAVAEHPELAKTGDRVRVSHLLVRVGDTRSEEQARALIETIHQRVVGGEEFAALATRYSDDPQKEQGGQMGWVAPGELLPELDDAMQRLSVGECSAPIQTKLGFHLIKVEERRTSSSLSVMEANHAVAQRLYQQKFQAQFARWLDELKRRAYIQLTPQ